MNLNKLKKSNVTVFIEVFNEEKRIESCLRSFQWADEIIVFDKNSTDRTRDLALKYASKVVLVPYCEGSENVVNNISTQNSSEWCLFPTASSLMHPRLADEIIKLTTANNFDFDVIGMPYGFYSLGVRSRRSPYCSLRKYTLIRRSKLSLSTKLHQEISYRSDKVFDMPIIEEDVVLYHCTHANVESMYSQIVRYTKYEAQNDESLSLARAFYMVLKAFFTVFLRRRTFLIGWGGVALSLSYISYFISRFLFIWERNLGSGNRTYIELSKRIDDLWSQRQ